MIQLKFSFFTHRKIGVNFHELWFKQPQWRDSVQLGLFTQEDATDLANELERLCRLLREGQVRVDPDKPSPPNDGADSVKGND